MKCWRFARSSARGAFLFALLARLLPAAAVDAAPVLRAADIDIALRTPTVCIAETRFVVETDGATALEHRLLMYPEIRLASVSVDGDGRAMEPPKPVGCTLALRVALPPGTRTYRLAYEVVQNAQWAKRCPIWVPTAVTNDVGRNIEVGVRLPAGSRHLADSFP